MISRRYVVARLHPSDERVLERALYNHTRVAGIERDIDSGQSKGRTVVVLETAADTDKDAAYLAAYQAGRLASFGSIGVSEVFDNWGSATMYAGDEYDAYPEMVHTMTPAQQRALAAKDLAAEFGTDELEWTL